MYLNLNIQINKHSGNFGELQSAYIHKTEYRFDKSDYNNSMRLIQVGFPN